MPDEKQLLDLVAAHRHGALVTLKRDGRPQLSTVIYAFDPDRRLIRVSVTEPRAKTRNLRRDPRASFYVSSADHWSYAVVESTAQLSPVATDPHDATVQALIDLYRTLAGEHPDWAEFRAAMVADQRVLLTLPVERIYGQVRG